jgi:hypothetical protein
MKKLLSVALCAAASMAMAATEVTIATVGVTKVTIPAGQQNTIIAASFNDLTDIDNPAKIAHLVKAANLADGDELRLYKGGKYSVWTYDGTDKAWKAATSVTSTGSQVGDDPATTGATAGSGLWFIRKTSTDAMNLVLFGAYKSEAKTSTIVPKAWNLIGNSSSTAFEFKTGAAGDKMRKIENGVLIEYLYSTKKNCWGYQKVQEVNGKKKNVFTAANPKVAPGEGIWYNTQSETTTLTWAAAES